MRPLAALTAFAALAACSGAVQPPAAPVLMRGGKWLIRTEMVDFHSPFVGEADRRKILAAKRASAAKMPARTECRSEMTARNWPKPGDLESSGEHSTCRYTRVERPGTPIDRTVECRGSNQINSISRTTGRLGLVDYQLRTESSSGKFSNSVRMERGTWNGDCDWPG